ncbi:acyltransferase [Pseudonocardia sp. KRD-182]|uniref:acyltransferase family protein n=1 Tax=Pseudonocardia oceani TaxID=2792013 RepID=UPI001C4A4784|nr:acyltransferase [Pseudonocardia oceani]MBW0108075.1 acyltransferase [Pseudonocardia oceani]
MPLDRAFDPRSNSVNALRLALAGLVLLSHTLQLHGGVDPIGQLTGGSVQMGTMAVDGFFALSGFLIVGSYLNSPSTGRYLWRRCLRILPGFWACLLVTTVVLLPIAQLIEFGTLNGFPLTGDTSALSYLLDNAALFIRQFEVTGLLGGEPVNGSLYTLFYEFLSYLGVAALGAVGLLRRRTWPLLVVAAAVWLFAISQLSTDAAISGQSSTLTIALRFGSMFLAGAIAHRLAHRIPIGCIGGIIATLILLQAVVLAALAGTDPRSTLVYVVVAPPAVAYLVLLLGASTQLRRVGARRDLSYGLYVYAWPVQILLLIAGANLWPVAVYGVTSLTIALLMAWASWTWIEAPALRFKSWSLPRLGRG